jgi:chloramphenicol-sensitive protein RarD
MNQKSSGLLFALSAFLLWGLLPFYWKALQSVPSMEIVGYRIAGSALTVGIFFCFVGRLSQTISKVRQFGIPRSSVVSGLLLMVNWGFFVWAINAGYVLQSSLAYYICPLLNVLLGVFVLKERLNTVQKVAIGSAGLGVAILTYGAGEFPFVALLLAVTFAAYGLVRKQSPLGPVEGHLVEMLVICLPAFAYLAFLEMQGTGSFLAGSLKIQLLLLGAGAVTALPLILFAACAKRLQLSTVGIVQYITPTLHFILAVFVFSEPFTTAHLIAFCFIWLAVALYAGNSLAAARTEQPVEAPIVPLKKAA